MGEHGVFREYQLNRAAGFGEIAGVFAADGNSSDRV